MQAKYSTLEDYYAIEINFFVWTENDNTEITIPRYNFMFFMYLKWLWLFFAKMLQKQFKFKIIEINDKILGEHKMITPKQQFLGIIL